MFTTNGINACWLYTGSGLMMKALSSWHLDTIWRWSCLVWHGRGVVGRRTASVLPVMCNRWALLWKVYTTLYYVEGSLRVQNADDFAAWFTACVLRNSA